MADQSPSSPAPAPAPSAPPADVSSYSDPLYDRLEGIKTQMAKRWPLLVILAIISAILVVSMEESFNHTPKAASAAEYLTARTEGTEALQVLLDNPDITYTYQVRAAISIAREHLKNGEIDKAREVLGQVKASAEQSSQLGLALSLQLSLAACDEQAGELDSALAIYQEAQGTSKANPALAFYASMGEARVLLLQAQTEENAEKALALRKEALAIYEHNTGHIDSGADSLVDLATVLHADLLRSFPELAGDGAAQDVSVESTSVENVEKVESSETPADTTASTGVISLDEPETVTEPAAE